MFKRIIIFVCAVFLFSFNVFAESTDNFYVHGEANTYVSEILGMTEPELKDYVKDNGITYLAVNKNNTKQIRKTEISDAFSKKIGNFLALKDNEILELAEELTGFKDVKGTVFEKGNKKFLKLELKTTDSGGEYYLTQYITVANSKKEILSFYTAKDESTDYVEEFFNSHYKEVKTNTFLKVLSVIGITLFSLLAVAVVFVIIKDTFVKKPTE